MKDLMSAHGIIHEGSGHHVRRVGPGHYEVYRNGITAATRCGIFHFSNNDAKALARAIAECNRRDCEAA